MKNSRNDYTSTEWQELSPWERRQITRWDEHRERMATDEVYRAEEEAQAASYARNPGAWN
jgi:hypothetical protein